MWRIVIQIFLVVSLYPCWKPSSTRRSTFLLNRIFFWIEEGIFVVGVENNSTPDHELRSINSLVLGHIIIPSPWRKGNGVLRCTFLKVVINILIWQKRTDDWSPFSPTGLSFQNLIKDLHGPNSEGKKEMETIILSKGRISFVDKKTECL